MSDQERISPHNFHTISSTQVNINLWIINRSNTKFSKLSVGNFMAHSQENYLCDLGSESVKLLLKVKRP